MKVFSGSIAAGNSIIANDDASNAPYSNGIDNGENGGYGFGSWTVAANGGGSYSGSSTIQGFGDININGTSWGLYAGSGQDAAYTRDLSAPLSVGWALSATIASAYRLGDKGFNLYGGTGGTSFIVNFKIAGDNRYEFNNTSLPSIDPGTAEMGDYSQTAIWDIVAKQTATSTVQVTLSRRDLGLSTSPVSFTAAVRGFQFYISNAPNSGNDLQNMRFNSVKVYRY